VVSERPSQEGKLSPGAPNDPVSFGKYYLLGLIARGGMAEVYRARTALGAKRLYAIKVMRPQLAREARFIDMFQREGKLAMLLKNRCIVETMEVAQHDARHYITMEYIGGRDLTQVLRRCQETQQRIPVPHAVYIAARIAEGLHFAHTLIGPDGRSLNIVNRDVSPSNVRLSYDGDVKLLDFGIAQALMKFTSEIGILKGKFSYMSPEQIRGMPLDARTDVFSAGIILHEMLTTEKLFRGDTEFALMEKVRKAEVPPPSKFNRRVPEALDKIVLKALARDLPDRYQSAKELSEDLASFMSQYRFQPTEMQEFVRGLFRADYGKEASEIESCRKATIDREPEEISIESGAIQIDATQPIATPDPMPSPALPSTIQPTPVTSTRDTGGMKVATPTKPISSDKSQPSGLWSRLRDKFTK
jgi:serine/threonine protein kinase